MTDFTAMATNWAEDKRENEAEAFEQALKRIKPEDKLRAIEQENAELRLQLREMAEENRQLRERITAAAIEYEKDDTNKKC